MLPEPWASFASSFCFYLVVSPKWGNAISKIKNYPEVRYISKGWGIDFARNRGEV